MVVEVNEDRSVKSLVVQPESEDPLRTVNQSAQPAQLGKVVNRGSCLHRIAKYIL
jgi:hypothetical protein